jgi:hypothetical protein
LARTMDRSQLGIPTPSRNAFAALRGEIPIQE